MVGYLNECKCNSWCFYICFVFFKYFVNIQNLRFMKNANVLWSIYKMP